MSTTKDRFYGFFDKKQSGCWEWNGSLAIDGYGRFWMDGKTIAAHRASYILHHSPIPHGKMILHVCDNPKCVNPHHLVLGTHRDNVQHMQERGRFLVGEQNASSRITTDQARVIIKKLMEGAKVRTLAKQMGFSRNLVKGIANKITWKHVWKEFEAA